MMRPPEALALAPPRPMLACHRVLSICKSMAITDRVHQLQNKCVRNGRLLFCRVRPCSRGSVPCYGLGNSLFLVIGNSRDKYPSAGAINTSKCQEGSKPSKFPVLFPVSRESRRRDRFAADCFLRHFLRVEHSLRLARAPKTTIMAGFRGPSSALSSTKQPAPDVLSARSSPNLMTSQIWYGFNNSLKYHRIPDRGSPTVGLWMNLREAGRKSSLANDASLQAERVSLSCDFSETPRSAI
jgi:hypothetical protein